MEPAVESKAPVAKDRPAKTFKKMDGDKPKFVKKEKPVHVDSSAPPAKDDAKPAKKEFRKERRADTEKGDAPAHLAKKPRAEGHDEQKRDSRNERPGAARDRPRYADREHVHHYPKVHDTVMTANILIAMFVPTEDLGRVQSESNRFKRYGNNAPELEVTVNVPQMADFENKAWHPVEITGEGRQVLEAARRISLVVDEVDECVLYLFLPPAMLDALGGNKGVHHPEVQRIGADCGARIWVPPYDCPPAERTVTLEGSLEQVRAGLGYIMEVLVPVANRHSHEELVIPGSSIGPVMGSGGKTLELIGSSTGCTITVRLDKASHGHRDHKDKAKGHKKDKDGEDKKEEGEGGAEEGEEGKGHEEKDGHGKASTGTVHIHGPTDGAALARGIIERLATGKRYRDALDEAVEEHRSGYRFFPAQENYATRFSVLSPNPYRTEEQHAALQHAKEAAREAARHAAEEVKRLREHGESQPAGGAAGHGGPAAGPRPAAGAPAAQAAVPVRISPPTLPPNVTGAVLPPAPPVNPWLANKLARTSPTGSGAGGASTGMLGLPVAPSARGVAMIHPYGHAPTAGARSAVAGGVPTAPGAHKYGPKAGHAGADKGFKASGAAGNAPGPAGDKPKKVWGAAPGAPAAGDAAAGGAGAGKGKFAKGPKGAKAGPGGDDGAADGGAAPAPGTGKLPFEKRDKKPYEKKAHKDGAGAAPGVEGAAAGEGADGAARPPRKDKFKKDKPSKAGATGGAGAEGAAGQAGEGAPAAGPAGSPAGPGKKGPKGPKPPKASPGGATPGAEGAEGDATAGGAAGSPAGPKKEKKDKGPRPPKGPPVSPVKVPGQAEGASPAAGEAGAAAAGGAPKPKPARKPKAPLAQGEAGAAGAAGAPGAAPGAGASPVEGGEGKSPKKDRKPKSAGPKKDKEGKPAAGPKAEGGASPAPQAAAPAPAASVAAPPAPASAQ